MRYFTVNTGQYPKYDNIQLNIYKNHNTILLFDWNSIFRSWHFVPKIADFKFRLTLVIDSKLETEDNILAILSSDLGEITIDEDTELIICKLGLDNTKNLRVYDGGQYSFDCAKTSESKEVNFMNQYAKNYYRLCSGRWSVDDNCMITSSIGDSNRISYMNYNEIGSSEIVTSFTYDILEPDSNV